MPRRLRVRTSVSVASLWVLCLTAAAAPAMARARSADRDRDPDGVASAFEVDPRVDVPWLVIAASISTGWLLRGELAPAHCAPLCPRQQVLVLDRWAAGRYDGGFDRAANIALATLYGTGVVALLLDGAATDLAVHAQDVVLIAESVLTANLLAVVSNLSTRRPRPYLYSERAPIETRQSGDGSLAFFSGHTAGAFAAATSLTRVFASRHPDDALPWIVGGAGAALAGTVGVSRVGSGDHFPSDVLIGAVVGTAVGYLVPELHRRGQRGHAELTVVPAGGGLLGVWTLRF